MNGLIARCFTRRSSSRMADRRLGRSMAPQVDGLEGRRLLTAPVDWVASGDTLIISGSNSNDSIRVEREGQFTPETQDDLLVVRTKKTITGPFINITEEEAVSTFRYGLYRSLIIKGHAGNDTIQVFAPMPAQIYGDAGVDEIWGGYADNTIYGGEGDDTIQGGGKKDVIYGGNGNDYIRGLQGNDSLFGEGGLDRLEGDDGEDLLDGGKDGYRDVLVGGDGADRFIEHRETFTYLGVVYVGVELERFQDFDPDDDGDTRWTTA